MSHESDYKAGQKDGQDLIDRAQALADFHRAERTGNADLNMTGEPNNSPERLTSHLRPLSANKGERPDWQNSRAAATMAAPIQGSEEGDEFNRLLNAANTVVQGGHAECNTAPGAGKISGFGSAMAEATGGEQVATEKARREAYKSPLAMTKSDLMYDPRSHH